MTRRVAVFTDTYLPTVNGVTYTIECWRDRWHRRGGRMDVVYPNVDGYEPKPTEHPVRSVPFPFYDGYHLGDPRIPETLSRTEADADIEIVHTHTPFTLGLAARKLTRQTDTPLVASYHTPSGEYASYLAPSGLLSSPLRRITERYERWFYNQADLILAPSVVARQHLLDQVGVSTPVQVLSNGVDIETFRPVDSTDFRDRYDLEGPLVGYTGRHGYEKCLPDLLEAVDGLRYRGEPVTLVLGGDGPARAALEAQAASMTDVIDVRFLGFLEREELPAFYSVLDVFAFPSPVETQGLVALEANACGTPVVGVDRGALSQTVVDDETGYHYQEGDISGFRRAIEHALEERSRLESHCLDRRSEFDLETVIEQLDGIYESVLES